VRSVVLTLAFKLIGFESVADYFYVPMARVRSRRREIQGHRRFLAAVVVTEFPLLDIESNIPKVLDNIRLTLPASDDYEVNVS
jgi:hypothetical protein